MLVNYVYENCILELEAVVTQWYNMRVKIQVQFSFGGNNYFHCLPFGYKSN